MPTNQQHVKSLLEQFLKKQNIEQAKSKLQPSFEPQNRPPTGNDFTAFQQRWSYLHVSDAGKMNLGVDQITPEEIQTYSKNIENFLGLVKLPIGLAGPLRVNGLFANGDYFLPLATTEAALVASYNRGTKLLSEAGGCTMMLVNAYVSRTPCFAFANLTEVGEFLVWINQNMAVLKETAEATTRFGKLVDVRFSVEGNRVFISFDYYTGDASGQNMVTIATQAAFNFIREHSVVKPQYAFVEANMSGDKKASVLAFQNTRGRKVIAECTIAKSAVEKQLHTSVDNLLQFSSTSQTGAILSGTIGIQGHYANALAALYIACGQDAACVSESSLGITRFEKTAAGDLYASVTLPNLMIGTVGGGTQLPSQRACLEMLGLNGPGQANAFAEVAAALCLAGELSISAAMASDTFTQAHQKMARTGTC